MSSTSDSTSEHFDEVAGRYAELRASPDFDDPVTRRVVELAALRDARVLDVGCGPGTVVRRLVEGFGADVVGVDASARMVETARSCSGEFHLGRAEALPFPDGSFDAVVMRMVAHLLDRPRAFAEILRVLRDGGRFVITTSDPAAPFWATRYFPSFAEIERARFPSAATLEQELRTVGFVDIRPEPFVLHRSFSREHALAKIRGRAYSTFALIDEHEYRAGLLAAEADLPEEVAYDWRAFHVLARA